MFLVFENTNNTYTLNLCENNGIYTTNGIRYLKRVENQQCIKVEKIIHRLKVHIKKLKTFKRSIKLAYRGRMIDMLFKESSKLSRRFLANKHQHISVEKRLANEQIQ